MLYIQQHSAHKLLESLYVHVKEFTNIEKSCTFHYAQKNLLKHINISIKLVLKIISSNKKNV